MEAKAVVFPAPNRVEVRTVNCPDPGPGDVVVRVTHSWISNGTEGSFLRGERTAGDTAFRAGDPLPFPIVAGYQKIGVVEWVGAEVDDITPGEVVFAATGKVSGMFAPFAGQISPSVSPRNQVWKLPQGVEPLAFSGLVLTQVGYNCGTKAPIGIADGAIVIGDGMVGQWAAQTLAWRGADTVLVGRHDYRLQLFAEGPLRHTVNARSVDWVTTARELLPKGARIVVDTVGSLTAVEQARSLMAQFGHIVSAGFMGTDDLISMQPLRYGELSLDFVSGWTRERMDETRALIAAGYLQTLPLITHRFPVDQAAMAWELIESKREPVLGVILDWA
jgi:3-hydroxyethyl bacteriochlorophyllide a dehydrogenase